MTYCKISTKEYKNLQKRGFNITIVKYKYKREYYEKKEKDDYMDSGSFIRDFGRRIFCNRKLFL